MSENSIEINETLFAPVTTGPVTRYHLRRTLLVYCGMIGIGMAPSILGLSGAWQAAGLGLFLPGAGFTAAGGWAIALFPLTLVLFAGSILAWFWAGVVVGPVLVWIGAAIIAAWMAPELIAAPYPHLAILAAVAVIGVFVRSSVSKRRIRLQKKAKHRRTFVPTSLAEVRERAEARDVTEPRELSQDQLQSLRYLLDRSLQPIDEFQGFDIIDQFQPAAIRYQLNHLQFGLGVAQGTYLPNFRGYMYEAQKNLIEKFLLKRVWDYWVYESMWGHLNFKDFDPAAKDNIMLTGWFGMQLGSFMVNTVDRAYAEPGSLSFRLSERTSYPHDFHTIIGSITTNYESYKDSFFIYPCEPNWLYPICNHYGMGALASHDKLFDTSYVEEILPRWLVKLDSEFTDPSGSIIGLRSQLTGIEMPFPSSEAGYAKFANCFAPDRGKRLWAIARKELEPWLVDDEEGLTRLALPGKGIDPGNYRPGQAAFYAEYMINAREFGDYEIAEAAQRSLDQDCGPELVSGTLGYLGGSNFANANIALGRLMTDSGDFRRSFVEGPREASLHGPYLTGVDYPEVIVAKAHSNGSNLDLVLYPGVDGGTFDIEIRSLLPDERYTVTGASVQDVKADGDGCVKIPTAIIGRTEVSVQRHP